MIEPPQYVRPIAGSQRISGNLPQETDRRKPDPPEFDGNLNRHAQHPHRQRIEGGGQFFARNNHLLAEAGQRPRC